MAQDLICYVCNSKFADLDIPVKCDGCSLSSHAKCSKLSATELKCISLKNRCLKFFCDACDQGLKEIPELKTLLKKLLMEVECLKNSSHKSSESQGDDFIINEINERNTRSHNLIFYNISECDTNRSDNRIDYDITQVNNVIKSISINFDIIPIKTIRIGRTQTDKPRPIKVTFSTTADVYNILKNKRKLSQLAPPSSVNISSDRTQYQREHMKKLRDELAARISNGEAGLTIKFFKGTPKIVPISNIKQTNSQHFLN
jgi:hypothetical protein